MSSIAISSTEKMLLLAAKQGHLKEYSHLIGALKSLENRGFLKLILDMQGALITGSLTDKGKKLIKSIES